MKKFHKMTALIAAALATVTLAGCTGGCSSCGGAKVSNNALTNSNWYTQTGYKGIQPYFIDGQENSNFSKEIITYDVTADSKNNGTYKVEYQNGTYRTEFYALEYNWETDSRVHESYRTEKTDIVYCYKTEFSIDGKFIMGDNTKEFSDSIVTESYFRAAYYSLKPVYSKQVMKVTSPDSLRPANIDAAYKSYDVVYENKYNYECTEVVSAKTENNETVATTYKKLNKTSNTLFDNSSLYTAIRSMKLSDSLSQTINLFNAQAGGISTIKLSGNGAAIEKEELAKISTALAAKDLYTPEGNDIEDKGISTVAVNIAFSGGEMSGTTQTVWYAALNDADNNTARCTMLKLSVPLPFGLGTLNYSLKEVQSTIWNGK